MPNEPRDIEAIALLDEPVRRALFEWVAGVGRAVSRDEAAAGVGISRALAAFHLDRLVREGLLEAEYRRLSGRTGPGAGRPAKLYRCAAREVAVSLPDRRYEIPAQLFATTLDAARGRDPAGAAAVGSARPRRGGGGRGSASRRAAAESDAIARVTPDRARRARLRTVRNGRGGDPVSQLPVPRPGQGPSRARVRHEPRPRPGDARRTWRRTNHRPARPAARALLRCHRGVSARDTARSRRGMLAPTRTSISKLARPRCGTSSLAQDRRRLATS